MEKKNTGKHDRYRENAKHTVENTGKHENTGKFEKNTANSEKYREYMSFGLVFSAAFYSFAILGGTVFSLCFSTPPRILLFTLTELS